jgi:hypothetical protein
MRQTTSRRGALGFLLAWAAGCTAKGPAYQPANIVPTSSTGVIYVYRPARTVATRGESPFVSINGKSYGAMKAGAFVAAAVPEGSVKVTVQQSVLLVLPTIPKSVDIAVVAGTTSYVRVDQNIIDAGVTEGVTIAQEVAIEEVTSEQAQQELETTRLNG